MDDIAESRAYMAGLAELLEEQAGINVGAENASLRDHQCL
jgi:hypothetical protein